MTGPNRTSRERRPATHDPMFGFPQDVSIDHSAGIADDELRFSIDSFVVSS